MPFLGIDLGGTKLAVALFSEAGEIVSKEIFPLENRKGTQVGQLITDQIQKYLDSDRTMIQSIGVSVPGISRSKSGTVWAPNIPGWEDYPLLQEIRQLTGSIPVQIESDRTCYILGEQWQGNAQSCTDAIYLSVGTGIGAGIMADGHVLHGAHDIAGAIGWMALRKPFQSKYTDCGCFEYYASGEGIARLTREILAQRTYYRGELRKETSENITAHQVFAAYLKRDTVAIQVINECIEYWGMAAANLISIFNPQKLIFGGGVFGPAVQFIPLIREEAAKWAQPVSMKQVSFEESVLGGNAGVVGAGFLALKNIHNPA
ncbi:ROK family protein [Rhodocytophaga rosea]|uniref:ROK family protein n=1 Tax=Rhodocytophaga rosea TaxID=2704465 RepID=A0A6C0GTB2_9BACT|nr:ROK family protein [Rhodocytophaga rosea]QHT70672.1 ROK family protein [Rhodocytophaga rosea]